MVIRQRRTILDPFFLKVVFPYLESGKHTTLMRLAGYWNAEVRQKQVSRKAGEWHGELRWRLGQAAERYHSALRTLGHAFQPQTLVPIPIAHEEPAGRRPYRDES